MSHALHPEPGSADHEVGNAAPSTTSQIVRHAAVLRNGTPRVVLDALHCAIWEHSQRMQQSQRGLKDHMSSGRFAGQTACATYCDHGIRDIDCNG
jgi:hypothetical protein